MTTAPSLITTGSAVEFDDDIYGRLRGSVHFIIRSVENGQMFAVVEIEHELPGILQSVHLEKLRLITMEAAL